MTPRSHDPAGTDRPHETPGPVDTGSAEVARTEDTLADAPAAAPGEADHGRRGRARRDGDAFPDTDGGKLGSAWIGLVLGALVTILLLIFIVQNSTSTDVQYFGWQFSLPLGVLVLFAAIAGALIMALFAGFRILQLRMRAHKARKLAAQRRR